ncbi:MAG: FKBP-type peptidyl-prolyl cis-trans isomerase [Prevotella sp.]|nr:FKBP-type peptidyl-prolyl cis-trans isomerase [Prevotella sp.]
MNETLLPIGTILRGVYVIEQQLASGGFGNTYKARNVQFDEHYAIKEFFMNGINDRDQATGLVSVSNAQNRDQYDEQLQKFKKEAQRLRRLNNDHIVRVHDLFEENGTAYYAMDFIDGESLSARLKRQGPLSEQQVLSVLPQVLDALKTVHEANLWHLDLKPANIMMTREEKALLIDFGASKQMSADGGGATSSTSLCYTPGFAPPEQVEQNMDKFGPWTDLYALGATLFNLLTNQKPPASSDINENADEAFLPLLQRCSRQMRTYVRWLMQPKRNQRPQSVAEATARMQVLFRMKPEPKPEPKPEQKPEQQSVETKLAGQPQPNAVTEEDRESYMKAFFEAAKEGNNRKDAPLSPGLQKQMDKFRAERARKELERKKQQKAGCLKEMLIGIGTLVGMIILTVAVWLGVSYLFSSGKPTAFNDHELPTERDTLAYAIGMSQTEGLTIYLSESMDVDTMYMDAFCEGLLYANDLADMTDYQFDPQKTAYNVGIQIGQQVKTQMVPALNEGVFGKDASETLPFDKLMAGLVQALRPGTSLMSMEQAKQTVERLSNTYAERRMETQYADVKRQGEEFLSKKRREQGVYELPRSGGVLYKVIKNGSGTTPTAESTVRVRYEGTLTDGTVFDSNWNQRKGTTFSINQVIPGWQSALQRMPQGSIWEVYIPQDQAYGTRGTSKIKPFSALVFKIELLEVK